MTGAPPATANDKETATATFEGETMPMDEVWEEAAACVTWPDGSIDCYRTIAEREEAEGERSEEVGEEDSIAGGRDRLDTMSGDAATSTSTSSDSSTCPVRLYSLTSYGGTELTLSSRWKWHNLSMYGFSNRASSYKIYGCSATFREGSNGSGDTYPGITTAWTWSSSMAYGWNNRVSSVWIH